MSRSRREIEALADIFVGTPATPPSAAAKDRVVAIVEGHLPVRAALWRPAAAGLLAGDDPATLLEVDDREVWVTHLNSQGELPAAALLEQVVAAPAGGHCWMVAGGGEVAAPRCIAAADEIVLMTGADQAAVVGAYSAAKQIVHEAGTQVRLRVLIAGSPVSAAEDVWRRLSETIQTHLGVEASLLGVLPQLEVAEQASRAAVPLPDGDPATLMSALQARPANAPAPGTTIAAPVDVIDPPASSRVESQVPPAPEPPVANQSNWSRQVRLASADRPDGLPCGVAPLAVETPLPDVIRLGVDADGGLHVAADAPDAAFLPEAATWAVQHRGLLALADARVRKDSGVVADVLVRDIHRAVGMSGGPWQVHLVTDKGTMPVPPPAQP